MKISKKVSCIAMAAVMCVGMMGVITSAEVISSKTQETSGGTGGSTPVWVSAERMRVTPNEAGFFGYDYTTYCSLPSRGLKADKWIISAKYYTSSSNYGKMVTAYNCGGTYISEVKPDSDLFEYASFRVTIESDEYGDTIIELNADY